jgi:hypothetical protein
MKRLLDYFSSNPHIAIGLPAIMCFIQFVTDIVEVFKTHEFTSNTLNQLASSANGFEAVMLFIIMLLLKGRNR